MIERLYKKRNFIVLLLLFSLTPAYTSCSLRDPDMMSFGFPFYALEVEWSGILPSASGLFWFGLFVNLFVLAFGYSLVRFKLDEDDLEKFLIGFSVLPFYLIFTGFLWYAEKLFIGTAFEGVLQSANLVFRIPGLFFYKMGEAMVAAGRDNVINFFNFGTGVSPDGAMRAIILLFSLGLGVLWALRPENKSRWG